MIKSLIFLINFLATLLFLPIGICLVILSIMFWNEYFINTADDILNNMIWNNNKDIKYFYIVEIRKFNPKTTMVYTEFSNLYLSDKLFKAIDFIKSDVNSIDGFTSYNNYDWYWAIIKVELNNINDNGIIVKIYDNNGIETTEEILLDL